MQGLSDSYEEVAYPGHPYPQTHPERLATIATLFGMEPAPAEACRVLEVGCGNGANLLPMALALPDSCFRGFDLAAGPIRRGLEMAEALGVKNLTLEQGDVRELGPELGEFDYIVAHGLYSWVPPEVREAILRVAGAHLAPQGVAYLSYNALPGAHTRVMMREMLLFHLRGMEGSTEEVREMVAFLKLLTQGGPGERREGQASRVQFMQAEAGRLLERAPEIVFHDELASVYSPVYFHEFAAHAARHGLQYLGEANFSDMRVRSLPQEIRERLETIPDRILREQYLDFFRCRAYRQTLLCHGDVELRERELGAVARLFFACDARPVSVEGDAVDFQSPQGWSARTAQPLMKSILSSLSAAWPCALSFEELLESTGSGVPEALGDALLSAYGNGLVEAHTHPPRPAAHAGPFPAVSPLNLLQLRRGNVVTTLRHTRVDVDGELERRLVSLLDGTRDRAALIEELSSFAGRRVGEDELERTLETLARLSLLVS